MYRFVARVILQASAKRCRALTMGVWSSGIIASSSIEFTPPLHNYELSYSKSVVTSLLTPRSLSRLATRLNFSLLEILSFKSI